MRRLVRHVLGRLREQIDGRVRTKRPPTNVVCQSRGLDKYVLGHPSQLISVPKPPACTDQLTKACIPGYSQPNSCSWPAQTPAQRRAGAVGCAAQQWTQAHVGGQPWSTSLRVSRCPSAPYFSAAHARRVALDRRLGVSCCRNVLEHLLAGGSGYGRAYRHGHLQNCCAPAPMHRGECHIDRLQRSWIRFGMLPSMTDCRSHCAQPHGIGPASPVVNAHGEEACIQTKLLGQPGDDLTLIPTHNWCKTQIGPITMSARMMRSMYLCCPNARVLLVAV